MHYCCQAASIRHRELKRRGCFCLIFWDIRFWLALRHENCMDPQLKSIVEAGVHGSEHLSGCSFMRGRGDFPEVRNKLTLAGRWTCVMETS